LAAKIDDGEPELMNMEIESLRQACALALLMSCAMSAGADAKSDYNRRAAARDLSLFQSLDRNGDGVVTRLEAHGDVNFLPRFDDMETNMDGVITKAELQRYLKQQYGRD
jgi:hypothetical protein